MDLSILDFGLFLKTETTFQMDHFEFFFKTKKLKKSKNKKKLLKFT
jgi:hypothetical protein